MDYELAKELKDAGFPQHAYPFYCAQCGKLTPVPRNEHDLDACEHIGAECAYAPTLEELIKATDQLPVVCGVTVAHMHSNGYWETDAALRSAKIGHARGSTAEDAVARLWLVLHANGAIAA